MPRYTHARQYRICLTCASTHVGPTETPTQCPYLGVHSAPRMPFPTNLKLA